MDDKKLFELGKQYKICVLKGVKGEDREVSLYTATVVGESKTFVGIIDRDNIGVKINKRDIIEVKEQEVAVVQT